MPHPPTLDGERLFKIAMATVLLADTEAAGGSGEDWERACRAWVPYHPAARFPERKLREPSRVSIEGEALPGEVALLEKLAQRTSVAERLQWLYCEDEVGLEARMADPVELGEAWDLSHWVSPHLSWEVASAWSSADHRAGEVIGSALEACWLCTGTWAEALGEWVSAESISASDLLEVAEREVAAGTLRLVLVLDGDEGLAVLDILRENPGLRDRVFAVVSAGMALWGRPDASDALSPVQRRDWMAAHFRHDSLDTEAMRLTPYCAFQWLDDEEPELVGGRGIPLEAARFGPPGGPDDVPRIESVDLGPIRVGTEPSVIARALVLTVALLVLSKR